MRFPPLMLLSVLSTMSLAEVRVYQMDSNVNKEVSWYEENGRIFNTHYQIDLVVEDITLPVTSQTLEQLQAKGVNTVRLPLNTTDIQTMGDFIDLCAESSINLIFKVQNIPTHEITAIVQHLYPYPNVAGFEINNDQNTSIVARIIKKANPEILVFIDK